MNVLRKTSIMNHRFRSPTVPETMPFHAVDVSRTVVDTIRVLDRTSNLQVAHCGWELKAGGVLRPVLRSNRRCAASAARICRETSDHSDQTCLLRFLSGSSKVT